MKKPQPIQSWTSQNGGELTGRPQLLAWIGEFARSHDIEDFEIYEFGVLNGESAVEIIKVLRGGLRKFTGFDTFTGIPALQDKDIAALPKQQRFDEGNFSGLSCREVKLFIDQAAQHAAVETLLIEGDFRNAKADEVVGNASHFPLLFHLDCDLYSSSCSALEFVAEVAQTGSWLLADDYWCYRGDPRCGQQAAIRDIMDSNPRIRLNPYCNYRGSGRAFVCYEI